MYSAYYIKRISRIKLSGPPDFFRYDLDGSDTYWTHDEADASVFSFLETAKTALQELRDGNSTFSIMKKTVVACPMCDSIGFHKMDCDYEQRVKRNV